jgi:hypothetical protein
MGGNCGQMMPGICTQGSEDGVRTPEHIGVVLILILCAFVGILINVNYINICIYICINVEPGREGQITDLDVREW